MVKTQHKTQKAWVVFSGKTEIRWLKFLKPGFRHCYVILNDGTNWLSLDPMSNHMELAVQDMPADFNLPHWLAGRGHIVVPADLDHTHKKAAPPMVFTCVEAVKRVLGLHKQFILTPWQLFRHLTKVDQAPQDTGGMAWAV